MLKHTLLIALFAAGCEQEDIQRYQVERVEPRSAPVGLMAPMPAPAAQSAGPQRTLAAIVPTDEQTWYFKVTGSPAAVEPHVSDFLAFISSVNIAPGGNVQWNPPSTWRQEQGSGMRYATFHLGEGTAALQLTVIPLAPSPVLDNINRWRDQIGLGPVTEAELDQTTRRVATKNGQAIVVDIAAGESNANDAPQPAGPAPAPGPDPSAAPAPTAADGFRYTPPAGWVADPAPSGFRKAAFTVGQGDQAVLVTVIPLGGPAGGTEANVNRWRGEVELPPATEQEITNALQPVAIGGAAGHIIELAGPTRRTIAAFVPRGEATWFFKMTGPNAAVEGQRAAFIALLESVSFE